MTWLSIVNAPKKAPTVCAPHKSSIVAAYAVSVGAFWGDMNDYSEKEDGPYKEFFNESARKRAAVEKEVLTDEQLVEYAQRIRDQAAKKEALREQVRIKLEQEKAQKDLCPCGCGRPPHQAPRPDFAGYCCGWCKQHKGKRGHGEACGK